MLALAAAATFAGEPSLFGPSNLETASGKRADPDSFFEAEACGECHKQQFDDWSGSVHRRAHTDSIYRAFVELAREEAGEDVYRFCSSCHTPLAIVTGQADFLIDEGVTCDVCHTVRQVKAVHGKGGANASLVIEEGDVRYGPLRDAGDNPAHESAFSEVHTRAEFCSGCHTLLHPHNGLVIENTYEEWRKGPYQKAGIQCQDCHMRTAEQALQVAKEMKTLQVPGKSSNETDRPNVYAHIFAAANTNLKLTGQAATHAASARERLQAAASIAVKLMDDGIEVAVTNESAGHSIPTSITELRQVWIDLRVTDVAGKEVFRSGAIDGDGRVDPDAVMYHSVLVDKDGKVTFKPWAAEKMIQEKLIGPKETVRERYLVKLPAGALKVRAVLRYRGAPQEVMDRLFGKGKYPIDVVDMCAADTER